MIPKKIHYIWLGKGKKSKLTYICINSWHEKLDDYEIIEWNEDNLDLDAIAAENRFFAECRKRKLWAYMADYLRLYILYREGGIYMDTDVQVLKKFDDLLNEESFIGYERGDYIGTGVIGAEKNSPFIKEILQFYDEKIWNTNIYTIPMVISSFENIKKLTKIYPQHFFAPYDYEYEFDRKCINEKETYTIHWYSATWTKNRNVVTFLQTKSIKSPIKKGMSIAKKTIKFYIQRTVRMFENW